MLRPDFKRFLYTIFETSGMFTGNFHSVDRIHAMSEGRRSLGLDILRTAERYAGPEALQLILAEEMKTLKETTSGKRSTSTNDRSTELDDGTGGGRPRAVGSGLTYLDYGTGS